jgi:hypothetical protein
MWYWNHSMCSLTPLEPLTSIYSPKPQPLTDSPPSCTAWRKPHILTPWLKESYHSSMTVSCTARRYPFLSVASMMADYTTNSDFTSQMMTTSDYDCYKATRMHLQQDTPAVQKHSTCSDDAITGLRYEGMWKDTLRIAIPANAPNPPAICPTESYTHCLPPNNPGRTLRWTSSVAYLTREATMRSG